MSRSAIPKTLAGKSSPFSLAIVPSLQSGQAKTVFERGPISRDSGEARTTRSSFRPMFGWESLEWRPRCLATRA
jgi:hypothetical protein